MAVQVASLCPARFVVQHVAGVALELGVSNTQIRLWPNLLVSLSCHSCVGVLVGAIAFKLAFRHDFVQGLLHLYTPPCVLFIIVLG